EWNGAVEADAVQRKIAHTDGYAFSLSGDADGCKVSFGSSRTGSPTQDFTIERIPLRRPEQWASASSASRLRSDVQGAGGAAQRALLVLVLLVLTLNPDHVGGLGRLAVHQTIKIGTKSQNL